MRAEWLELTYLVAQLAVRPSKVDETKTLGHKGEIGDVGPIGNWVMKAREGGL
jgi:hypothetical protein